METKMFCYQCQETAGNKGCTVCGVCGKNAEVAALQDSLVYETKLLSRAATEMRKRGETVLEEVNHLVTVNLFTTITNANFDADAIRCAIEKTRQTRDSLAATDAKAGEGKVGVLATENEEVDAFIQRALAATLDDSLSVNDLISLTLETGKFGVDGMALLDKANTSAYGNPEITNVDIGVRGNNELAMISK